MGFGKVVDDLKGVFLPKYKNRKFVWGARLRLEARLKNSSGLSRALESSRQFFFTSRVFNASADFGLVLRDGFWEGS